MRLFLDSSSYAKRFIEEPGSARVDALIGRATELFLSVLCIPEIFSALNRRRREGAITREEYVAVKVRIAQDIEDANIINITSQIVQTSIDILEYNPVRALDALQIACALACQSDAFVSSDARQIQAARKSGLKSETV